MVISACPKFNISLIHITIYLSVTPFILQDNVPAESYTLFMDTLLDTVRGEIAACIEKAYLCIPCAEAARRLNLSSQQAVLEYGKKVQLKRYSILIFNILFNETVCLHFIIKY